MTPIRLGVIFDQQVQAGGGYQQALNAAMTVKQLPADLVQPVFFTTVKENVRILLDYDISATLLDLSKIELVWMRSRRLIRSSHLLKAIKHIEKNNPFERALIRQAIDLVYFLSPTSLANDLEKLNYITTVWDLSHRDDPEFPEVRWNRIFEQRDRNYQSILPRATAILVDSELGKANVARRYGIDYERVHVMPFQGAVSARQCNQRNQLPSLDIKKKYHLGVDYIFYPAQFWAHKNHVYLLQGLKSLEDRYGLSIGAIFAGGDRGNADYVKEYSRKLGLCDRIRFAGFVSNDEVPQLYKQSVALVMPTYFGPTNLPPLEAFELGVPVLYPDREGLREQVWDAGLLMDLKDPDSMADHLKGVCEDESLREKLRKAGWARLSYFDSFDRVEVLRAIIADYRRRRLCWK